MAAGLRWRSRRVEERRAEHKRYKEDVERAGKPFFPYAMFHDTVMSLVVVVVIVGLSASGTSPPTARRMRASSAALHGGGRPGHDGLRAAPDWFFYFLFYLLRIFKWPDTVVLGTVGIPNILLGIAIACRSSTSAASAG